MLAGQRWLTSRADSKRHLRSPMESSQKHLITQRLWILRRSSGLVAWMAHQSSPDASTLASCAAPSAASSPSSPSPPSSPSSLSSPTSAGGRSSSPATTNVTSPTSSKWSWRVCGACPACRKEDGAPLRAQRLSRHCLRAARKFERIRDCVPTVACSYAPSSCSTFGGSPTFRL